MTDNDYYELLHNARILVVEDDNDIRELILRNFSRQGYANVDAVGKGRDALNLILGAEDDNTSYDLLVLDLMLPGKVSGQDIYHNLSSTLDIPIVVLSGIADTEVQLDALQYMDVEEYFVKPVDMQIFMLKCERIITRRILTGQITAVNKKTQRLFLNVLQVMAKVLEAKDPYTRFHSENVAKYSRQIARKFGFLGDELEMIQIAGILHDFGKIGITEMVLNKPGNLTEPEYLAVRKHPMIAATILEPIEELTEVIDYIKHHHERYDGRGYPDKLEGEDIPLGARILCVADSFDAMTSKRSYHDSMCVADAIEELVSCSGSQFDPEVVKRFIEVLEENEERKQRLMDLKKKVQFDG